MRMALQPTARRPLYPLPRQARPKTFPAPVRGWVTNTNLSEPLDQAAFVLDNWFPVQTGIRLRGGTLKYASLGAAATSMWTYQSGSDEFLFAATATDIFDITTIADADVPPTADVTGLNGGDWTFVQFETSGGDFLLGCNGADTPQEFDGSSWSNSTMTGLTTSLLSHVWAFKNRLFFIEDGTMRFWYLSVGSITGGLTSFSLAGVFAKGGSLLLGATWSLDAGDGVDDLCVLVSTLGEVAVYQGTNPGDAAAWSLVGRYEIAAPLGKNCIERAGGELLIGTVEGIVPISEAINKDRAALSLSAISRNIEPDWVQAVTDRSALPWTLLKYSERNMMIVGMPSNDDGIEKLSFVVNLETGAWTRFTGATWDVRAQAVLRGVHYVGDGTGLICQTDSGGSDNGENYTCTSVGHFVTMGSGPAFKTANLARATFRATQAFNAKVSASVDYTVNLPSAPDSVADSTEDAWDAGLWDTAIWDGTTSLSVTSNWQAITATGFAFAPQVQVTCGVTPRPDAELMSIDVMFETGAVVV